MIWGYRRHLPGDDYVSEIPPLSSPTKTPRRDAPASLEIYQSAPGVLIVEDAGVQVKDFSHLAVGDLVFFDADPNDGTQIDHVGMYLGRDSGDPIASYPAANRRMAQPWEMWGANRSLTARICMRRHSAACGACDAAAYYRFNPGMSVVMRNRVFPAVI